MKNRNDEITSTWSLVDDGQSYNSSIGYYETVDLNDSFIRGDQWRGVVSNGLPTPVFNIIKRVRDYKVSSIMSQKITGIFNIENVSKNTENPEEQELLNLVDIINNYIEIKWEKEKMDSKLRDCLMDGYSTGDFCIYTYWDSSKETGQDSKGDFTCEVIDGVNVLFGNPNNREVEKQPYIIILGRDMVNNLKEEAKNNGISKQDYDKISSDEDTMYTMGEYGKKELDKKTVNGKCTYAIKLWKENGKIYFTKSTKYCEIKTKVDMRISKYPVAFGNWEKVKNSYHGRAECTGILPNQRYINKQFAMIMTWMMYNALGKVAYDSNRIPAWSNQIGTAIPVNGDITGAIQQIPAGNFNGGILDLVNLAMRETLQVLGVNDVVLGNIKPDNTSAIIAVQKQSAVPLENVQGNLYQFVEDIFLIWAEFIKVMYTSDRLLPQKSNSDIDYAMFNSTKLKDKLINVKVEVGASTFWSEISSIQTLDALLRGNYITMIQYLERLPNGMIPQKQELIEEIKTQMEQQPQLPEQEMQMPQQEMQMPEQEMQMPEQNMEMSEQPMESLENISSDENALLSIIENLPDDIKEEFINMTPEQQMMVIQEFLSQQGGE